ncbi:hypothetical protein J6590_043291 [Homalodisca vitripennis]|nr:hypothetical protein J6590_043291 [Homalodisca vitripennis]
MFSCGLIWFLMFMSSSEVGDNDVEPIVPGYPEEDTEEQYVTRSNHYGQSDYGQSDYGQSDYGRQFQRNDYSPELASPA